MRPILNYSSTPSLRPARFENEDDDEYGLPDKALTPSVGSSVAQRSRENEVGLLPFPYSAFTQLSDPVTFTDTSVKKR
jgi:hypothetical protein